MSTSVLASGGITQGTPCTGYRDAVPVERSELQLVWPPALFAAEAIALLEAGQDDEDTLGWLLAEAFHGDRGYRLFVEYHRAKTMTAVAAALENIRAAQQGQLDVVRSNRAVDPAVELVAELIRDAEALPRYRPKRYYSQRHRPPEPPAPLRPATLRVALTVMMDELNTCGYFEDAFGSSCTDAADDPDREGQRWLSEALETDGELWPLGRLGEPADVELTWDDDLFFDLVEALDEVVARPRRRRWHDYANEWDYDEFARRPGQAVYRWRVNELLARSEVNLRLADSGPDAGLLVQATGDPRDELLEQALTTPDATDRSEVEHAVALFRARGATREDKRSAVVALARVLEHRRALLKDKLPRKDEGALFQIANEFDLRHRRPGQQGDYGEAFLNWVFWWYLGTVELTDRLRAEQDQAS